MKTFRLHNPILALLALLLWQISLIFQGLDFADTGFHLTAFTYIFESPYSVQYSMSFWLSEVVGHLWMSIWPSGGLIWARIGWIVPISISIIIYYRLLISKIEAKKAVLGLGITTIFVLQGGPESLNYDILTILGYAVALAFLYNGLLKNKQLYLFFAGLALGISFFFRLTNFSALAFVIIIFFWSYIEKKNLFHTFKLVFSFIMGIILGFLLICSLIWFTGQHELFLDNLPFLSITASDNRATHGFTRLISSYLMGYINAIIMLAIAFALLFSFTKLSEKFRLPALNNFKGFLFIIIIIVTSILMIVFEKPFWSKVRYFFIGLMLFEAFLTSLDKNVDKKRRLLVFSGLLLLIVTPLGSDTGLEKSVFGMWILGPLVLTSIDYNHRARQFKLVISENLAKMIQTSIALLIFTSSVFYAWQSTYYDAGNRADKVFALKHPKMKWIYTSKKRADVVNELIVEGFPKIERRKYLLAFINVPMLNYLADKEPFISSSWPKLYYSPEAFEKKLYEAIEKRKTLPSIIRQKQNTGNVDWPKKHSNPHYFEYKEGISMYPEHGKILNHFIEEYNYKVIWENEMFQVLLPV
jgi:hypothetical protein